MRYLIILLFMFFIFTGCAYAQEPINMEIIKQIESGGDPHAYNKRSGATGLYQITPICLEDFIRFSGIELIQSPFSDVTMELMYDPATNKIVAEWYLTKRIPQLLKHFNHEITLDNILISYNCGVGCVGKKLPRETRNYLKKYRILQ